MKWCTEQLQYINLLEQVRRRQWPGRSRQECPACCTWCCRGHSWPGPSSSRSAWPWGLSTQSSKQIPDQTGGVHTCAHLREQWTGMPSCTGGRCRMTGWSPKWWFRHGLGTWWGGIQRWQERRLHPNKPRSKEWLPILHWSDLLPLELPLLWLPPQCLDPCTNLQPVKIARTIWYSELLNKSKISKINNLWTNYKHDI